MASFWTKLGRWLDSILGGSGDPSDEVDPSKVDAAIRLIQSKVEEERRARQVPRLRVNELGAERQAELANELKDLLRKPPAE